MTKPFIKLLTVFIFFTQNHLQNSDALVSDGTQFLSMTLETIKKPLSWGKNDFLNFGYISASATLLYTFDDEISRFFKRNQTSSLNKIEFLGDFYGRPNTAVGLTTSMFVTGSLFNDRWMKETSLLLGSTLAVTGFFQFLLTRTTGRFRPEWNKGKSNFSLFSFSKNRHSFPSGHTTIAISTSLVLASQVKSIYVKAGFYLLGGITVVSRVYEQAHFSSDVFVGSALAYYVFKSNYSLFKKWSKNNSIALLPTSNGISISLSFN